MSQHFSAWLSAQQQRMEVVLDEVLPPRMQPRHLQEVMRYAVLNGGKRVRPMLVFAAGEIVAALPARLEKIAAAVELVHVYSLVHDDLPAMDDDILRRGKVTTHIKYDEASAVLAGDALQSCAFEILSEPGLCASAAQQLELIRLLSHAIGARGMCGGQVLDLQAVGRTITLPELEMMHIMKTGALIRAAVLMGATCGQTLSAQEYSQLDHFARCIGLAFQVVDDILDAEGSTDQLGKTAGKDRDHDKPTYVSLLGLAAAREKAQMLYHEAMTSLAPFGRQAIRLEELASFIIKRHY